MSESYSVEAILSARDAGFTAGMKAAQKSTESLGSILKKGIGFGAFAAAGGKAVSAVTNNLSGLVAGMNESSATWKTFTGNMTIAEKSTKQITKVRKNLQKFAEQTIYSSSDMASTYAQLAAVGTKNTTKLVKGFGGLASAAEDLKQAMKTLSQQATQMAAKPKVQWEDFKLMVEQTPAGVSAVAKTMGKSTQQMIKDVQDGKIATEDFFNAVAKTGTNKQFTKMATEYKTVGQAMDGLTETVSNKLQPAFDSVSSVGIKAVSAITDSIDKIDGKSVAKKIGSIGKNAGKYWKVLSSDTKEVRSEIGSAVSAIGGSLEKLNGSFGSTESVSNFKSVVDGAASGVSKFAGFCEKNSDSIAKLITVLPKVLIGYKAFKVVKTLAPGVSSFSKAILSLLGKGIGGLAAKLFGVAAGETAAGNSAKVSKKYNDAWCWSINDCRRLWNTGSIQYSTCKFWGSSNRSNGWNDRCFSGSYYRRNGGNESLFTNSEKSASGCNSVACIGNSGCSCCRRSSYYGSIQYSTCKCRDTSNCLYGWYGCRSCGIGGSCGGSWTGPYS